MKTRLAYDFTRSHRGSGFTLIEIMIVVTIIALLASITIPSIRRAIDTTQTKTCAMNLKSIDGAKVQWAAENRKPVEAVPTDEDLFGRGRYIEHKPECPASGRYTVGAVDEKCTCSVPKHIQP